MEKHYVTFGQNTFFRRKKKQYTLVELKHNYETSLQDYIFIYLPIYFKCSVPNNQLNSI